jgi:hypothetical protein
MALFFRQRLFCLQAVDDWHGVCGGGFLLYLYVMGCQVAA